MRLGVVVPRPSSSEFHDVIDRIHNLAPITAWVRGVPRGSNARGDRRTLGSLWDPFMLLAWVVRMLPPGTDLGTAVVRMDYRLPEVVARCCSSLARMAPNCNITIGMGCAPGQPTAILSTAKHLWTMLDGKDADYEADEFNTGDFGWAIASGSTDVWDGVAQVDSVSPSRLTAVLNPRDLADEQSKIGVRYIIEAAVHVDNTLSSPRLGTGELHVTDQMLDTLVEAWVQIGVWQIVLPTQQFLRLPFETLVKIQEM